MPEKDRLDTQPSQAKSTALEEEVQAFLLERYGPLVPAAQLWKVLHFPTADAFRRAVLHGRVSLQLFRLKGRRGRFAAASAVAAYVAANSSPTRRIQDMPK